MSTLQIVIVAFGPPQVLSKEYHSATVSLLPQGDRSAPESLSSVVP